MHSSAVSCAPQNATCLFGADTSEGQGQAGHAGEAGEIQHGEGGDDSGVDQGGSEGGDASGGGGDFGSGGVDGGGVEDCDSDRVEGDHDSPQNFSPWIRQRLAAWRAQGLSRSQQGAVKNGGDDVWSPRVFEWSIAENDCENDVTNDGDVGGVGGEGSCLFLEGEEEGHETPPRRISTADAPRSSRLPGDKNLSCVGTPP